MGMAHRENEGVHRGWVCPHLCYEENQLPGGYPHILFHTSIHEHPRTPTRTRIHSRLCIRVQMHTNVHVFHLYSKTYVHLLRQILAENLQKNGYPDLLMLHGDMDQHSRTQVISDFKKGKSKLLVATDVAARGLDIPDVRTVVNFDIARDIDTHTHRIGRTGRAGVKGEAHTLVEESEAYFAGELVQHLEQASQQVRGPDFLAFNIVAFFYAWACIALCCYWLSLFMCVCVCVCLTSSYGPCSSLSQVPPELLAVANTHPSFHKRRQRLQRGFDEGGGARGGIGGGKFKVRQRAGLGHRDAGGQMTRGGGGGVDSFFVRGSSSL